MDVKLENLGQMGEKSRQEIETNKEKAERKGRREEGRKHNHNLSGRKLKPL